MPSERSRKFVSYVLERINGYQDKGFAAKLKKADNENTEYQSWEILARWTDINYWSSRKAYGLIGASLGRSRIQQDGKLGLGKALYQVARETSSEGDVESSPAGARLRRLLACKDSEELTSVLRPVVRLIESKEIPFCRAQLLDDILWFSREESRERTRTRWAQEFYGNQEKEAE